MMLFLKNYNFNYLDQWWCYLPLRATCVTFTTPCAPLVMPEGPSMERIFCSHFLCHNVQRKFLCFYVLILSRGHSRRLPQDKEIFVVLHWSCIVLTSLLKSWLGLHLKFLNCKIQSKTCKHIRMHKHLFVNQNSYTLKP